MILAIDFGSVSAGPNEEVDSPLQGSFLALGFGLSHIRDATGETTSDGLAATFQFGQRIRPQIVLVEEYQLTRSTSFSSDPTVTEGNAFILVGIRWSPIQLSHRWSAPSWFLCRYVDYTAFYLKATIGMGIHTAYEREATTLAPAVGAATGWMPMQGRDYALGLEVRGQVARYSDGLQKGIAVVVLAQLGR